MKCFRPIAIDNPDYVLNDEYTSPYKKILVPCGRCPACIVNQANDWRQRLQIEFEQSSSACFITLTYDDKSLPFQTCTDSFGDSYFVPVVCKRDVQLFLKRLRKRFEDCTIRYYLVSEYGPNTFRPHYHAVVFNLPYRLHDGPVSHFRCAEAIRECWGNGMIKVDPVTSGRISYVTKYMSCVTDLPEYLPKPFRLMSRRPGIGFNYFNKKGVVEWHRLTKSNFIINNGFQCRLPRYYKDKLFDDAMKLDIKEESIKHLQTNEYKQKFLAECFGYNSSCDFISDSELRFLRQFNNKMKKSRKDI